MPKLINNQTQQLEDVSYDTVPEALQTGSHSMQAGQTLNLLSPEGHPVSVPVEDVFNATQEGYHFPTQAHVDSVLKDNELQQKYGTGVGNSLKAMAAGAARGASFGLSDLALTQTGAVHPDTLQQIKERNPIASTVGQVAGIGAGLLAGTGEAGGVLEAANAPALLSKVATGISTNPAVAAAIGKYGSAALGSAVEGAAYGAGNVVSEAALGDPQLNSEKALSEIGLGALIGGGIGGAFSMASDAIPASVQKAKELFQAAKDPAMNVVAKGASIVSGKPVDAILDTWKTRGAALTPEASERLAGDLTKSLQEQVTAVNKASRDVFKDIRPQETAHLLDNTHLPAAQNEVNKLYSTTEEAIAKIRANPEVFPQRYAAKLTEWQNSLVKADQGDAAALFKAADDFKKLMGPEIKYGKMPNPEIQDAVNLLKGVRDTFKQSLENESVWGPAAARQAAVNDAFNEFSTVQSNLEKDLMKKVRTRSGSIELVVDPKKVPRILKDPDKLAMLQDYQDISQRYLGEIEKSYQTLPGKNFDKSAAMELIGKNTQVQDLLAKNQAFQKHLSGISSDSGSALGDFLLYHAASGLGPAGQIGAAGYAMIKNPGVMIQRLAAMEKTFAKVANRITIDAKAIFSKTASEATAASSFAPPILSQQMFEKKLQMIVAANQDPNRLVDNFEASTRGAYSAAPNTVGALHQSASRALAFLQTKLPSQDTGAPLDAVPQLTAAQRNKFGTYLRAVEQPTAALKDIKAGLLRPETVETLKEVYPKLYETMQGQLMMELTNHKAKKNGAPIPLQMQNSLSLFLGNNMTSNLSPSSMHRTQQALSSGTPQPLTGAMGQSSTKGSISGLKALTGASMLSTPMQRSSARNLRH